MEKTGIFNRKQYRMNVTYLNDIDELRWNDLAAELDGGFFYSHAEVLYRAQSDGDEPFFVQAHDDNGTCIGLAAGAISRAGRNPLSRFCRWAMLPTLPLAADSSVETVRSLLVVLEKHLRRRGVFSVRIDAYDCPPPGAKDVLDGLGYELEPRDEFAVDLTASLDDIWTAFKGHRRTDIRKAEKLGVRTCLENDPAGLDRVLAFRAESMRRREIEVYDLPSPLLELRCRQLELGQADVFVTYQNEEPVNASLFGFFNRKPYYHISGASDGGYRCCGPVHLIWTAIQTYKERGARSLNLGAAGRDQKGLYKFKRDFGSRIVAQARAVKKISAFGSMLHCLRQGGRSRQG